MHERTDLCVPQTQDEKEAQMSCEETPKKYIYSQQLKVMKHVINK